MFDIQKTLVSKNLFGVLEIFLTLYLRRFFNVGKIKKSYNIEAENIK